MNGKEMILGNVRRSFGGDHWGTCLGWLFGMADVTFVESGELLPEYTPSPLLSSREGLDGYESEELIDLLDAGLITLDDIKAAYATLDRASDILRAMGRSY